MAGTPKNLNAGPAYLAAAAANIYAPPAATILTILKKIRVANKTGAAASFTLYKGATGGSAGGTELFGLSVVVPANGDWERNLNLPMFSTDFLSGLASAANTLTITVEGEQQVVP
jgi:hypothetical protein